MDEKSTKVNLDAAKVLADLAKEMLKSRVSSDRITEADQKSTSEYNQALYDTLHAINEEIKKSNDTNERNMLYKQRENIMTRLREEKEEQRQNNNEREEKDRKLTTSLFATTTAVLVGAGAIAAKLLLDNRK